MSRALRRWSAARPGPAGRPVRFVLLALVVGLALPAFAAEPHLLRDLSPDRGLASSSPRFLGRIGGQAVFVAGDGVEDDEPWISDGTEVGTRRLADVCPGPCGSSAIAFGQSRRAVFFRVRPQSGVNDLWATDGTPQGTLRLFASPQTFRQLDFFEPGEEAAGDRFFFAASDGISGEELWVSDGTAAGTLPVSHFQAEPGRPLIQGGLPFGNGVVFLADGPRGPELWASDGTPASTRPLLAAPVGATEVPDPRQLFRVGETVYFTAQAGRQGRELWRTDGTPEGTRNVADLVRGPRPLDVRLGARLGSRFLFVAATPQAGQELWVTDGTAAGTRLLRDLLPGPQTGLGAFLGAVRGRVFFAASDGVHGTELWSSDGTARGTALVRDLCRGSCSSRIVTAWKSGEELLVSVGLDGPAGEVFALWRSDGSPAGTYRLSFDGPSNRNQGVLALPGVTLLALGDPASGRELWRTDGTREGTRLVADVAPGLVGADSRIDLFLALGNEALFLQRHGADQVALWRSDGSEAGTRLVADLPPGDVAPFGSEAGGKAFFLLGRDLWRTDGTAAGTFRVSPEGTSLPDVRQAGQLFMVAAGDRVYLNLLDSEHGIELWSSDGSREGTRLAADLAPGPAGSRPLSATAAGGRLFFTADVPGLGRDLWKVEEGASAPSLVKDFATGAGIPDDPTAFFALGDRLYFQRGIFPDIWRSDGSEAGTVAVLKRDQIPGAVALYLVGSSGGFLQVFVRAGDPGTAGTYVTEGTLAGLRRMAPAEPVLDQMVALEGRFLWTVGPRRQLRVADGSEASARPLLDRFGHPVESLVFRARLGARWLAASLFGEELWETDGTPAGTRKFESLLPRIESPAGLAIAGGKAYFVARDREHGAEPWVLDN